MDAVHPAHLNAHVVGFASGARAELIFVMVRLTEPAERRFYFVRHCLPPSLMTSAGADDTLPIRI